MENMENQETGVQQRFASKEPDAFQSFGLVEKRTWQTQEQYLAAYAVWGTNTRSSAAAHCDSTTAYTWIKSDLLGFRARREEARKAFQDSLEDHALEIAQATPAGKNPLLLITLLNANLPDKYRPQAVSLDDRSVETLGELRKLSKKAQEVLEKQKKNGDQELKVVAIRAGEARGGRA